METIKMWEKIPGMCQEEPVLEYYKAENKKSEGTVIICPGGGYVGRAEYEGKGYAEFFNSIGIDAFVVQYRVSPHHFPLPLLDARRAVRWVRYHAEEYGINPEKIAIMGSSAGGHLAALTSTYRKEIEFENIDEIDNVSCMPNFQILCYPVIQMCDLSVCHIGSVVYLMGTEPGNDNIYRVKEVDPIVIADENTPPAFIWHTSNDPAVNVCNSLRYGEKLRALGIQFEMHIFPDGYHGLGLATDTNPHVSQWSELLKNWLGQVGYFK